MASSASRSRNEQFLGWDSWKLAEEHGALHTLSAYTGLKFLVVPTGKQEEKT